MNEGKTVFSQLIGFLPDRDFRRCVSGVLVCRIARRANQGESHAPAWPNGEFSAKLRVLSTRLPSRSFPPVVRGRHSAGKHLAKVFNHRPPDQRRDNSDREIHTREDIAQGERYTLPFSISLSEFPHQQI